MVTVVRTEIWRNEPPRPAVRDMVNDINFYEETAGIYQGDAVTTAKT